MGIGRRLGEALAAWLESGDRGLENGVALGNRFGDLLGSDAFLIGPVRDLARRPLFQQALRCRGLARRSALRALAADLANTYAPAVLAELLDLLAAGLGEDNLLPPEAMPGEVARPISQEIAQPISQEIAQPISREIAQPISPRFPGDGSPRNGGGSPGTALQAPAQAPAPALAPAPAPAPALARDPAPAHQRGLGLGPTALLLARELRPLLPGLGFAALMVAVLAWLAGVVDRMLIRPGQGSAGLVLALLPLLVPLLTVGPLRRWRGAGLLPQAASDDPHQVWRWASAPWLHRRRGEALLHALLLALILGPSPLPLDDLVLRYGLSSLACLALAALTARWLGLRHQEWGGAAGAVAALVGLAVGLSLLHRRELGFPLGEVAIPAWVLLVVASSLQLAWILPRRHPNDPSRPLERLLASPWWWGLVLGGTWAGLSWVMQLLAPLLRARPA